MWFSEWDEITSYTGSLGKKTMFTLDDHFIFFFTEFVICKLVALLSHVPYSKTEGVTTEHLKPILSDWQ